MGFEICSESKAKEFCVSVSHPHYIQKAVFEVIQIIKGVSMVSVTNQQYFLQFIKARHS